MYIAFEGPIGAGKTTLAEALAKELGVNTRLILEGYEDNPFLKAFYEDRNRWALPMQLTFMLERRSEIGQVSVDARNVVADHSLLKESVFASRLLRGDELALYSRISDLLPLPLSEPDLIVYVDAANDVLLRRIAGRGRPYEAAIDADYIEQLRGSYFAEFAKAEGQRILRIDTSDLDINCCEAMSALLTRIIAAALPVAEPASADNHSTTEPA